MKIAFLCSSLEIGRDGVGDYSRRLAAQLIRNGHSSTLISLHDPHVPAAVTGTQEMEGTRAPVLRLPSVMPWSERVARTRQCLDAFQPDWISLQFVPFGFHHKGLCFGFGKHLAAMHSTASWHVMFHELWLGLEEGAPLKHRVWGAAQRMIVKDLLARLRPRVVNTQAEPHRIVLKREKVEASILPLFGNIPAVNGDDWRGILEPLIVKTTGKKHDRAALYLVGMMGRVPPEWSMEQTIHVLLPLTERFQKRLALVFFGKNHLTAEAVEKLKKAGGDHADVVFANERTDAEMSEILNALDLGIGTTPRQMIQKSGAAAAMLEHGLTVLVMRDDWRLRGADFPKGESPGLLFPEQVASLKTLPARNPLPQDHGVKEVARRMAAALAEAAEAADHSLTMTEANRA